METDQILDEIREVNLSYLLLAQQMLREDKAAASYRLGIDESIAEILIKLSNSQLLKMAASNMLLCRFRFDDALIAEILTDHKQDRALTQSHAAILMAGIPAEKIS